MNRWVQRFTPLLADAARPCRHAVGDRWQVDETYVKLAGRWRCVYPAIDQFGQVVDVFVSRQRDAAAAHRFFQRAIGRGSIRESAASTARSAQSIWGRGTFRRSTATSCRNTSSSALLVAERRASSTSHPSSWQKIR